MRPVYRMQCGCMQRAHQRAANNHKEQTKPDTSMPDYTTNTLCSQLIWTGFPAVIFHQRTFTALTTSPEPPLPKMLHALSVLHHAYPLPLHPRTNILSIAKRGTSLRGDRTLQTESNRRVSVLVPHTHRIL